MRCSTDDIFRIPSDIHLSSSVILKTEVKNIFIKEHEEMIKSSFFSAIISEFLIRNTAFLNAL